LPTAGSTGAECDLDSLLVKLRKLHAYTGDIVSGKIDSAKLDVTPARELSSLLSAAEPLFAVEAFEQLCKSSVNDTLMCVYLSRLARSQTALAEKISVLAIPEEA